MCTWSTTCIVTGGLPLPVLDNSCQTLPLSCPDQVGTGSGHARLSELSERTGVLVQCTRGEHRAS